MRLAFVALALAWVLASCGHETQPNIDDIPYVGKARVVAVTVPESLAAGARIAVEVHWWKRHCSEWVQYFERIQDRPRHWTVTPVTLRFPRHACIAVNECATSADTFEVVVPPAGVDSYTVEGFGGAIDFEVAAGIGANDAGHRILLLDRATSLPLAGKAYTYNDWAAGMIVANGVTDGGGVGRVAPPPCGSTSAPIDLVVSGSSCGEGVVRFDPGIRLCGRALRTTILYGAFPPESTASVATPSM